MIHRITLSVALVLPCAYAVAQALEREAPSCASEAVARAKEGAARNEAASLYLMARYYSTGKCFAGDGDKAVDLYWQAAKLNYPAAFYNLGVVAVGGEKDYKKAELMFFRGAQLGHRGSELQLALLYQLAPAPLADNVKSYAWLMVTTNRGEPISREAKGLLEDLDHRITGEERDKGKALAARLSSQFGNVPAFAF